MSKNIFTDDIGHVVPSQYIDLETANINFGLYRGTLISNPNMMFLKENDFDVPLLEIDVLAHRLLSILIGKISWPDEESTDNYHKKIVLSGMEVPEVRYLL